MALATQATEQLTDGQKAWLAVGLARVHELPMATAITYAQTVAELLPTIPADSTRRCHCGEPIGSNEQWCSSVCYLVDEGPDRHELDEAVG